ncbi:hypothetical protein GH714_041650 [Hevea brasiliensis]|uniref:Uncharacterized protein n=1 Tax=Hevea brasiliensis TaxID=3981 RepID=A0A6A6MWN2_HEVBR|nr:hypothetical protein GH714_041650 [Hevea brasiliensis]
MHLNVVGPTMPKQQQLLAVPLKVEGLDQGQYGSGIHVNLNKEIEKEGFKNQTKIWAIVNALKNNGVKIILEDLVHIESNQASGYIMVQTDKVSSSQQSRRLSNFRQPIVQTIQAAEVGLSAEMLPLSLPLRSPHSFQAIPHSPLERLAILLRKEQGFNVQHERDHVPQSKYHKHEK